MLAAPPQSEAPGPPPPPCRITIMTWNVWSAAADGAAPPLWPQRAGALAALLRAYLPDVLCAQELHPLTDAAIRAALPATYASAADSCDSDGGGAALPPPPAPPLQLPPWLDAEPLTIPAPAQPAPSPPAPQVPPPFSAAAKVSAPTIAAGGGAAVDIYYNTTMFALHAAGVEALNLAAHPRCCLRYCLLRLRADAARLLLVATCQLPPPAHPLELQTGVNQRIEATKRVIVALRALAARASPSAEDLPTFLVADLNEDFHPPRLLSAAGFVDCFTALGVPAPPTHPARPSLPREERHPDRTLDWIFAAAGARARPVTASVVRHFRPPPAAAAAAGERGGGSAPPSAHCPVLACYEV